MAASTPRGIRNNNPGNIRHGASNWQGQATIQMDSAFVTFKSPQYGIRAIARTLLTYQNAHRCDTVRKIINRWAPPNENDTLSYVKAVAEIVGVDPDQEIVIDQVGMMLPIVRAIIQHENGQQPYSQAVLMDGLRLAGVADAKPKPLFSSKQVLATVGSVAASGGSAAVGMQGLVGQTSQALQPYAAHSLGVAKAVAILAGIGATLAAAAVLLSVLKHKAVGQ